MRCLLCELPPPRSSRVGCYMKSIFYISPSRYIIELLLQSSGILRMFMGVYTLYTEFYSRVKPTFTYRKLDQNCRKSHVMWENLLIKLKFINKYWPVLVCIVVLYNVNIMEVLAERGRSVESHIISLSDYTGQWWGNQGVKIVSDDKWGHISRYCSPSPVARGQAQSHSSLNIYQYLCSIILMVTQLRLRLLQEPII